MTDNYITVTDTHGIDIELHAQNGHFEVYCASSKVGEISPEQMYAAADNDKIVIPDGIVD